MGVFLFCKVRVTSSQSAICPLPRRITGYNSLVTTPSPLFRRSNFVVDKGLQIPEERLPSSSSPSATRGSRKRRTESGVIFKIEELINSENQKGTALRGLHP
ncbi:8657_t:CDS:2 [Entrophospora sp. SA101]|nr:8657_t:CDS:2 [Entrophospora sp. SA101]